MDSILVPIDCDVSQRKSKHSSENWCFCSEWDLPFYFPLCLPSHPIVDLHKRSHKLFFNNLSALYNIHWYFAKPQRFQLFGPWSKMLGGEMCGLSRQLVSEPLCYVLVTWLAPLHNLPHLLSSASASSQSSWSASSQSSSADEAAVASWLPCLFVSLLVC